MTPETAQRVERILSGEERGVGASALRAGLAMVEPFYAAAMAVRNRLYDSHLIHAHRLPVPVISVGNITAGGTGKTPVVRWLTQRLQSVGLRPAILMRGYKREGDELSDEQALLQESLNDGTREAVVVHADPDRVAGGKAVLREQPEVNVLVLDDGFQHRRLHRDFDLVLIDAANPFGHGHVLPRGLLREPLKGLARAGAFILTRSDQVDVERRKELEGLLRGHNHRAPVYLARHAHAGLRSASGGAAAGPDIGLDTLDHEPFFAFAGIGRPGSLHQQLLRYGAMYKGQCWFEDHHPYDGADMEALRQRARAAGASMLLTTEKDWVKVRGLPGAMEGSLPIRRLALEIALEPRGEEGLINLIRARIERD